MLYIIGMGVDARVHITNEAINAIRNCSIIFALCPDTDAIEIIKHSNPSAKIIDCERFYNKIEERPTVYELISKQVINSSSPYTDSAFVVYGNPMFLVSAVEKLIAKANLVGLKTKVIPGVSSFDTVLADLKLDLGYGVVIVDASLLIQKRFEIDPRLPLLIFQVANLGSNKVEHSAISSSRLIELIDYLLLTFPEHHQCKLVVSRYSVFQQSYIISESLGQIVKNENINLTDRPTLYVPPLQFR